MAKASGAESAEAALAEAEAALAELVDLEDYYFGADKEERKRRAADTAVAAAETALTCVEKPTAGTQAKASCVKGKALSFLPGQERQAEELLSKALKLDPQHVQAWNALGEVYWNQRNYAQARSAFEQALQLCGPNSTSLRNLSMVLRAVDGDELEKTSNCAAGLRKAKEATVLDANDPQNWETLGNAYLGEFFINGKRTDELAKAMIAYARAEAAYEKLGKRNPTLHMNRGTAAKFMEDYPLAIRSFEAAAAIGEPKGAEELEKVMELLQRLEGLVERKGDLKMRRLKELAQGFPLDGFRSLKQVRENESPDKPLIAKLVSVLDRKDEIPVLLVCCDSNSEFFVMSMYNTEYSKVAGNVTPLTTTLQIRNSHFRKVDVVVKGVRVTYPSIRMAHPGDVGIVQFAMKVPPSYAAGLAALPGSATSPGRVELEAPAAIGNLGAAAVKPAFTSAKG